MKEFKIKIEFLTQKPLYLNDYVLKREEDKEKLVEEIFQCLFESDLIEPSFKDEFGCDNCDHDEYKPCEDVKEVKMKEEFNGGKAKWCAKCRKRDSDFIKTINK